MSAEKPLTPSPPHVGDLVTSPDWDVRYPKRVYRITKIRRHRLGVILANLKYHSGGGEFYGPKSLPLDGLRLWEEQT